jgi:hypothetical protein
MIKKALNYLFRVGTRMVWKPLYYILLANPLREWMLKFKITQIGKGITFRPEFDVFGGGGGFIGNNVQLSFQPS